MMGAAFASDGARISVGRAVGGRTGSARTSSASRNRSARSRTTASSRTRKSTPTSLTRSRMHANRAPLMAYTVLCTSSLKCARHLNQDTPSSPARDLCAENSGCRRVHDGHVGVAASRTSRMMSTSESA